MKRWAFLFLLLEALSGAVLVAQYWGVRDRVLEQHSHDLSVAWRSAVERASAIQNILHKEIVGHPWAAEALERAGQRTGERRDAIRTILLNRVGEVYDTLSVNGVEQLQFITGSGESLLRFHRPELYDDSLLDARPSVGIALRDGRRIEGFETGKLLQAYRVISPIRKEGVVVGLVETGMTIQSLRASLDRVDPDRRHSFMLLARTLLPDLYQNDGVQWQASPMGPEFVVEAHGAEAERPHAVPSAATLLPLVADRAAVEQMLRRGQPFAATATAPDGKDVVIAFQPLREISGRLAGHVVTVALEPSLSEARAELARHFLLASALLLVAVLLFAQMLSNRWTLRKERSDLKAITDTMVEGLYVLDADARIVFVNRQAERLLGYSRDALLGADAHALFHSHSADGGLVPLENCPIYRATVERRPYQGAEEWFSRKDGSRFPVQVYSAPLGDGVVAEETGMLDRLLNRLAGHGPHRDPGRASVVTFTDVTARRATEQSLRKLSQAVEQSPSSVVITSADGNIEYVNPKFEAVTGYRAAEVVGANPRILKSGHMGEDQYAAMWQALNEGGEWRGEFHNRRKDGTMYWEYGSLSAIKDGQGRVTHYLAVKEDITVRKQYEERLIRQANYDDLTGLPNRTLTFERLKEMVAAAERLKASSGAVSPLEQPDRIGVLFIDLDNFKHINDSLGHVAGDLLLTAVARRLSGCLRTGDTLSRQGGDEFLLLQPDLSDPARSEETAAKVLDVLRWPFAIDGREIFIGASIGITLYPDDATDPHELLRNADSAMYTAKAAGRMLSRRFVPEMNRRAARRLDMESRLRRAQEDGALEVLFQPLVNARSGRVVGAEALLRWHEPEWGTVSPVDFIPIAEETGLIVPIGAWVLDQAIGEAAAWRRENGGDFLVAVNVSSRQFKGNDLARQVAESLARHGLPSDGLELELTESLLLDPTDEITGALNTLSSMGIKLSIDDFGTGYSALGYLKKFPFDVLKIDRTFIQGVIDDAEDAALARAIVAMAHGLGLTVIAEGVETPDQHAFARDEGCDLLQGYYFGRPMSAAALRSRLAEEVLATG